MEQNSVLPLAGYLYQGFSLFLLFAFVGAIVTALVRKARNKSPKSE
ncbi:MAG: hypothetical protein OEW12_07425 [Deltaproteobacteria bacterium]|nr:hypothetical protein [Deltaproteobacteria bacterium]